MESPPSLSKETSTPSGRRLWMVTLGVTALIVLIGIVMMLVGRHIGLPR
jgi:hypothetical protein